MLRWPQARDEDIKAMRKLGFMIAFAFMVGTATLVAFVLGHLAHDEIGLAPLTIRHSALIAGALIAVLIVA
jgi:hypothetical protein